MNERLPRHNVGGFQMRSVLADNDHRRLHNNPRHHYNMGLGVASGYGGRGGCGRCGVVPATPAVMQHLDEKSHRDRAKEYPAGTTPHGCKDVTQHHNTFEQALTQG